MTKKHSTKRALIASILMLALCITSLVGTTFAWFTDSVTSANNIIKTGNLDIELYYQAEGQSDWTKVTKNTNVFKEDALWEPGHTEVVKFKIVNEGSLALKYQLGVSVASEVGSVNVNDEAFKLSDFIKFGIVAGAQSFTRDQAVAAVDATATELKTAYASDIIPLDAKNDSDSDERIVTMVVYMPTEVGNDANYKKGENAPSINLGVNLVATQYTAESDSFGSDYDAAAPLPEIAYGTVAGAQAAITAGKATVNVPAEAGDGNYTLVIDNVNNTVNANDETVVSFDLSLEKDGAPVAEQTGVEYEVKYFVGTELQIINILHKGVAINDYDYDPGIGYITFNTASFSPFEITYVKVPEGSHKVVVNGKTQYFLDIHEAVNAANGETAITLGGDVVLEETLVFDNDATVSLDMNGFSISGQLNTLVKLADGSLSVTNGSFKNVNDQAGLVYYNIYMCGDAVAKINNVNITTKGIGIMMTENAKITDLNANVDSFMKFSGDNCFDAISLLGNARIDVISGGNYEAHYTDDVITYKQTVGSPSQIASYALRLNDANTYVGEISGGTFLSIADYGNMGAPLYVNNGTVDLISGGHFGFSAMSLSNLDNSIFVNLSNGGNINAIKGGTFVKGAYNTGFRWDFEGKVDASGCKIVDTGKTSEVSIQWSKRVDKLNLSIIEVVAK